MYFASRTSEVDTRPARVAAHCHFTWSLLGLLYDGTCQYPRMQIADL